MDDINNNIKHFVYCSDNQNKVEINEEIYAVIEDAVYISLNEENIRLPCEVSFTFVDDEEIREINREYRNIDKSTDVLSFPLIETEDEDNENNGKVIDKLCDKNADVDEIKMYFAEDINPENNAVVIGDIIISAETAQKQSENLNQSFEREVIFLTVHSVLHLLGYDHEKSEEDEKIMFDRQAKIMKIITDCREL